MRRRIVGLAFAVGMVAASATAGDHQQIAGDRLEARECYVLRAPKTVMYRHRYIKKAGAWNVPVGNIICVNTVDRRHGQLWYRVQVMAMGTSDASRHIPGWIDSRQMMQHGVFLSY